MLVLNRKIMLLFIMLSFSVISSFAETPESCKMLEMVLQNEEFTKLFKVDTNYRPDIIIYFQEDRDGENCIDKFIHTKTNSFKIIDEKHGRMMNKTANHVYECSGVYSNNEKINEKFILSLTNDRYYISATFIQLNKKWYIENLYYSINDFIIGQQPEEAKATAEANLHLKEKLAKIKALTTEVGKTNGGNENTDKQKFDWSTAVFQKSGIEGNILDDAIEFKSVKDYLAWLGREKVISQ